MLRKIRKVLPEVAVLLAIGMVTGLLMYPGTYLLFPQRTADRMSIAITYPVTLIADAIGISDYDSLGFSIFRSKNDHESTW